MKIDATITRTHTESVTIDPMGVVKQIKLDWMKSVDVHSDWYINPSFDTWEEWEDTHGSGQYTAHRKATPAEIVVWDLFRRYENVVKSLYDGVKQKHV